jgi:hypothetical protein
MLVNTGRRTISREAEIAGREAFLQRHREQRLALGYTPPDEDEFAAAVRVLRPRRTPRPFGAARREAVRPEPVFRGDPEADLVAATAAPVNFARVGG